MESAGKGHLAPQENCILRSEKGEFCGNGEIVRRFLRAYTEAVHLLKTNKPIALRAMLKYTRVKDQDILEETHNEYRNYIESIPYVSRKGAETILSELALSDPKARQAKPDDFVDMRFVAEMGKDGYFRKLEMKATR